MNSAARGIIEDIFNAPEPPSQIADPEDDKKNSVAQSFLARHLEGLSRWWEGAQESSTDRGDNDLLQAVVRPEELDQLSSAYMSIHRARSGSDGLIRFLWKITRMEIMNHSGQPIKAYIEVAIGAPKERVCVCFTEGSKRHTEYALDAPITDLPHVTETFHLPVRTDGTTLVPLRTPLKGEWRGGQEQLERHFLSITLWRRRGLFVYEPYAADSISLETLAHAEPFQQFNLRVLGSADDSEAIKVYSTIHFEQVSDFVLSLTDIVVKFPPGGSIARTMDSIRHVQLRVRTESHSQQKDEMQQHYPDKKGEMRRLGEDELCFAKSGTILWRSVPSAFVWSSLQVRLSQRWEVYKEKIIFEVALEQLLDNRQMHIDSITSLNHPEVTMSGILELGQTPQYRQLGLKCPDRNAAGNIIVKVNNSTGLPKIAPHQSWVLELSTLLLDDPYEDPFSVECKSRSLSDIRRESSYPVTSHLLSREMVVGLPAAIPSAAFRNVRATRGLDPYPEKRHWYRTVVNLFKRRRDSTQTEDDRLIGSEIDNTPDFSVEEGRKYGEIFARVALQIDLWHTDGDPDAWLPNEGRARRHIGWARVPLAQSFKKMVERTQNEDTTAIIGTLAYPSVNVSVPLWILGGQLHSADITLNLSLEAKPPLHHRVMLPTASPPSPERLIAGLPGPEKFRRYFMVNERGILMCLCDLLRLHIASETPLADWRRMAESLRPLADPSHPFIQTPVFMSERHGAGTLLDRTIFACALADVNSPQGQHAKLVMFEPGGEDIKWGIMVAVQRTGKMAGGFEVCKLINPSKWPFEGSDCSKGVGGRIKAVIDRDGVYEALKGQSSNLEDASYWRKYSRADLWSNVRINTPPKWPLIFYTQTLITEPLLRRIERGLNGLIVEHMKNRLPNSVFVDLRRPLTALLDAVENDRPDTFTEIVEHLKKSSPPSHHLQVLTLHSAAISRDFWAARLQALLLRPPRKYGLMVKAYTRPMSKAPVYVRVAWIGIRVITGWEQGFLELLEDDQAG